jgi:hypothetical protein
MSKMNSKGSSKTNSKGSKTDDVGKKGKAKILK